MRFPSYIGSGSTPVRRLSEVVEEERPVHATCKAHLAGNGEETYIYKRVDRFGYVQEDSQALEHELRVLEMLHSTTAEGIVKLTGVVVSENPYQTIKDNSSRVLRGILLEYHPNGTLEEALASARRDTSWQGWGLQIASALALLHERDMTHMDLKPEDVVISKEDQAVVIDVGGHGGYTREWLAPEMLSKEAQQQWPLLQSTEARKQNDIWALGKMLSAMADVSSHNEEKQLLASVAREAATERLPRIPVQDVVSRLSRAS